MQSTVTLKVASFFDKRKDVRVLYVFDDGNMFTDKNFALNHQRQVKSKFEVCNREDFSGEITLAKKSGNSNPKVRVSAKTETLTLKDQLKDIDLSNVEGKYYPTLRKLVEGLNLPVENKKLETLVAAIEKAKAELLK